MSADHPGNVYDPACSARDVLDVVGSKWVMLIMPLLSRPLRNGELLRRIPGISQKVLTQTLRDLERNGLVSRTDVPAERLHVEYEMTQLGRSLWHALVALDRWAEQHFIAIDAAKEKYDELHARNPSKEE